MNKKFLMAVAVISFLIANSASAAVLPSGDIIAPDSSFYFLQTWKESIQTFFTFGAENKAKQYLHLAEVRLNEYQNMIDKGKTEIAEKTLNKYEEQLNRALTKAQELKDKGKDIEDLSQKIEEATSKHLEVLQENLQKAPEQAKEGLENAIENSQKEIEKILGKKSCVEEGKMCGGIAGILCCSDLKCQMQGNYPDASGTCVKEEKKDETANWKTYRNEKYGFELKYPPNLIFEEGKLEILGNYGNTYYKLKKDTEDFIDFNIWYWDKNSFKTNKEGPTTFYERLTYNEWLFFVDNFKNILSGKCSENIIENVFKDTAPKECSLVKDENYIRLETEGSVIYYTDKLKIAWNVPASNKQMFNQILSTFKFIK